MKNFGNPESLPFFHSKLFCFLCNVFRKEGKISLGFANLFSHLIKKTNSTCRRKRIQLLKGEWKWNEKNVAFFRGSDDAHHPDRSICGT
jgi:hypothetical protein